MASVRFGGYNNDIEYDGNAMKTLFSTLLIVGITVFCHAADLIEKSWFPTVNGVRARGEYVDLNTNNTERLYIRYCPIDDSGVELERTSNNVVVWRTHVQPIIPRDQQVHSKYCHEVSFLVYPDRVLVNSAAGLLLGRETGSGIYANSEDAKQVEEFRSLKTGALISRRVRDLPMDKP
jgi:hypothetical protein